jgi:hypothetical protein
LRRRNKRVDYKPNSHRSKEEPDKQAPEKKVEKAVVSNARVKKKGELRKFADVFISEDVQNVKSYVILGVLVPAIKKAISDIITNGIDMILYGESGRSKRNSTASRVSYRDYYDRDKSRTDYLAQRTRTGYSYDDVYFDTRGEAEEVLSRMDELISTYDMVSVADLYDLVGVSSNYTDNNYGWTDLKSASVERGRDGYYLKLPKIISLK